MSVGRLDDGMASIFINFLLFALISSSFSPGHGCSSNLDCPTYESCCGNACKPDHYCLGYFCYSDTDCGIYGSCCASGTLTSDRKCRQNCTSGLCFRDSDCGRQERCLDNKCALDNCIGSSCDTDSECPSDAGLQCCFKASRKDCDECRFCDTVIAAAIVMIPTVLIIICVLFKVLVGPQPLHRCCQRLSLHPGQRHLPPYPGRNPPPYHITCSDNLPPPYDQREVTISLLDQSESSCVAEAPPPYSATPEITKIRSPQPVYGAVMQ